ncbi:MAG: glycosyltransferase family 2 protein [Solibacillus sp.]
MDRLVSIIVPIYNKENYLEKSITSLMNQTFRNIEIVLVNDGSKDNSEKIIMDFIERDKRIIYKKVENGGVSRARNLGMQLAKGDYIGFLDADDFYEDTFVEKMVKKIGNGEVCYCGSYLVEGENKKQKARLNFKENDIIEDYILNKNTPNMNSWLLKKEFLIQNNLQFEESLNWGEDILFFAKILTLNQEVKAVKEYLTNYNVNLPNSLSSNSLDKIEKDIECLQMFNEFLQTNLKNSKKMHNILECLEGYRLPALIIFRLYSNKSYIDVDTYNSYKVYINKLKFNNGLRSLKVYIYKYLLLKIIKK